MNKELYRNGSGYADPTAYKAMITIKEENRVETRPFEIWRYFMGEKEKMGVIIAQRNGVVAVLPLFEKYFNESVEFPTVQGIMYAHPIRISFVFENRLIGYVQDVPESAVNDIMNLFYGCYSKVFVMENINVENDCGAADVEMSGTVLPFENVGYSDNTELQIQLEGERREKEVYKKLYENLLEKIVK